MSSIISPQSGSWRGQLGSTLFPASRSRYHLYIGLFCPFAHRVNLTRTLKRLTPFLPMSIVRPYPKEPDGWCFPENEAEYSGSTVDHLFGSRLLREVYFRSPPDYSDYKGKYSVPVLWDTESGQGRDGKKGQIVNNESEDIMRQLNTAFNEFLPQGSTERELDFYPPDLRDRIDEINTWLVGDFNNGVYKAGFAPDQETYEKACKDVFKALDKLEAIFLEHQKPYVLGLRITELDLKAYATLIRFDNVYVQHFKVNIRMVRGGGYPACNRFLKNMFWNVPGVRETTDFRHIKENYTKSHGFINPRAIVWDLDNAR